jgi:hypothetical protein
MAALVVEGLERVHIEHEDRERPSATGHGVPQLPLERPVIAQPGERILVGPDPHGTMDLGVLQRDRGLTREQLGELELVGRERGLCFAHPPDVERADRLAVDEQGNDDHGFRLERGAGHLHGAWIEVRLVGADRLAVVDHPAGDPDTERALVRQDQLREPIPRDDGAPDAGFTIGTVDRQRVVWNDRLERIRDQVEDAGRVEHRQQPLVDLEEATLAFELVFQFDLLPPQALHVACVDNGVGSVPGKDRQGRLVVRGELIVAVLGHDEDAVNGALVHHRHEQGRSRLARRLEGDRPRVHDDIRKPDRLPELGHPSGQALADPNA